MNQINITFESEGFLLKGMLHLPKTDLPPVVIGSHGLLSNSYSPKQLALARECNAHGMAYFRFDHRGCGQSDGVFNEITSLNGRRNDLISAISTLQMRKDIGKRIGLFGSSMGGAVCISVADILDIDAWVTYASPVRSSSVSSASKNSDGAEKIQPLLDQKYLTWDISDQLKHLHHIFILHGDSDTIVSPANAHEIYTKSKNPKKLIIQKGGNHPMSNKKHQKAFLREAVNWFKKWLIG
ncbi:MAG: alpha/beta hydrolase [Deltaproteobacteria bacterium]|jgi:alpha-beta hydrolase superfamily lysophospholipase|nr:alpha/beta hydrolase [Deltaproteobacteria bacterium]